MTDIVDTLVALEYALGFHSDIDTDLAPKGLTESVRGGRASELEVGEQVRIRIRSVGTDEHAT